MLPVLSNPPSDSPLGREDREDRDEIQKSKIDGEGVHGRRESSSPSSEPPYRSAVERDRQRCLDKTHIDLIKNALLADVASGAGLSPTLGVALYK